MCGAYAEHGVVKCSLEVERRTLLSQYFHDYIYYSPAISWQVNTSNYLKISIKMLFVTDNDNTTAAGTAAVLVVVPGTPAAATTGTVNA